MINLHPLCHYANSTHYAKLYPQNGERVVTIDSVTSFHPTDRRSTDAGVFRRKRQREWRRRRAHDAVVDNLSDGNVVGR